MLTHWKVFAGPMRELCGGGLAEQDSVIGRVIQRQSRDCRLRIFSLSTKAELHVQMNLFIERWW